MRRRELQQDRPESSVTVTLPKDDLREFGIVDESGELIGDPAVYFSQTDDGFELELLEGGATV